MNILTVSILFDDTALKNKNDPYIENGYGKFNIEKYTISIGIPKSCADSLTPPKEDKNSLNF